MAASDSATPSSSPLSNSRSPPPMVYVTWANRAPLRFLPPRRHIGRPTPSRRRGSPRAPRSPQPPESRETARLSSNSRLPPPESRRLVRTPWRHAQNRVRFGKSSRRLIVVAGPLVALRPRHKHEVRRFSDLRDLSRGCHANSSSQPQTNICSAIKIANGAPTAHRTIPTRVPARSNCYRLVW